MYESPMPASAFSSSSARVAKSDLRKRVLEQERAAVRPRREPAELAPHSDGFEALSAGLVVDAKRKAPAARAVVHLDEQPVRARDERKLEAIGFRIDTAIGDDP